MQPLVYLSLVCLRTMRWGSATPVACALHHAVEARRNSGIRFVGRASKQMGRSSSFGAKLHGAPTS